MTLIKKLMVCVCFSSMAFCLQASTSPVSQLEKALTGFNAYQARFSQKTTAGAQVLQSASGTVSIERPGKFRWETLEPMHQLLLVNGDTVWSYDVDLAQATRQTLTKQNALNAAFLLSGNTSDLLNGFSVSSKKAGDFILRPKHPMSFDQIELVFKDHKLLSMKTHNTLGQQTAYSFTGIQLNKTLPASLFEFHPPKGVDVIS
jgi:outer membrane lipoprotein carrier protein